MTDINLIKRNEQPTPLTHEQVDSNWQTIEDAVNELNNTIDNSRYIISGFPIWSGVGLEYLYPHINYVWNGVELTAPQGSITLDTSDVSFDRFDLIVLSENGTVSVIKGTASDNPIIPTLPNDRLLLLTINVKAGMTEPNVISEIIYNENSEWTTSILLKNHPNIPNDLGSIDFDSTNEVKVGAKSIHWNTNEKKIAIFKPASLVNPTDWTTLSMWIMLKEPINDGRRFEFQFYKTAGNAIGNYIDIRTKGLNQNLLNTWQLITIPIADFNIPNGEQIERLRATFTLGSPNVVRDLYIDYIRLTTDVEQVIEPLKEFNVSVNGQLIGAVESINFIEDENIEINGTLNDKTADISIKAKVVQSGGIGGGSAFTDGGATNTLTFASSKWYGTSIAPITNSSILFDITNAVSGSQAIVYHSGSSEPMYPSGTIKRGIGSYINGQTNILTFTFLKTNEILLDVDMMNPASFPEVNYWLQRGGVASGFLLNALNQFMATIQPMRSKIIRFNPLWGETFASIFVPLIVNTDGSTTPIGNPTDANSGFVEANWNFYGEVALTNSNYLKYISTSFNPFNVSEVGQDDICVATIVKSYGAGFTSYLFTGGGNLRANIHGTVVASQSASFNSSSVASVPNTAVGNTRQVLFYNRTKSTEFEVHKNGVKQIVPAPSTAVEDSNLIIGSSSVVQYLYLVGGYLISKGLTDTEISLFTGAWNTLIAKIGRI